jgi:hypothetical protein
VFFFKPFLQTYYCSSLTYLFQSTRYKTRRRKILFIQHRRSKTGEVPAHAFASIYTNGPRRVKGTKTFSTQSRHLPFHTRLNSAYGLRPPPSADRAASFIHMPIVREARAARLPAGCLRFINLPNDRCFRSQSNGE